MRFIACMAFVFMSAACGADSRQSEEQAAGGPKLNAQGSGGDCDKPFARSGKLKFKTKGWATDFCKHSIPYDELRSGGPPRDGIPPIDAPKFISRTSADAWLNDVEPVISLEIDGAARAYPLQILIWHEIVNDELNGLPVAVTFCPLCYAAVVFRRPTIKGKKLTFGTSGNLRKSDMVMWDRQTESWWQQFEGLGIVGSLTGTKLEVLPAAIVSWKSFKSTYPEGEVLSRETGIDRPYGRNPYVGYDDVSKKPFLYKGKVGKGLAPMEHIVGIDRGEAARAYSLDLLRAKRVLHDTLNNEKLVIFWQKGTASALDKKAIADGDDAGATGVFSPQVDGRSLTFRAKGDDGFTDVETKTHWDILGHARSGPLTGKRLLPIAHHRVFWFAWSAFVAERGSLFAEQ
jgi:hypothetical protein